MNAESSVSAPLSAPVAASQSGEPAPRIDLLRIAQWIAPGSRVLDLGCGDGRLLAYLQQTRQVRGAGVEIDDEQVIAAVRRGVSVIQQNLEGGLALFDDAQFDTVVLSQTLQSMRHTEHILREMARVARYGIVSFPNFGHWQVRLQLLFAGHMPRTDMLPFSWYDTPNIHHCTIKDFRQLCTAVGVRMEKAVALNAWGSPLRLNAPWWFWNLFGEQAVFLLSRRD